MPVLRLKPSGKDYLWGGSKLKTDFNKEYNGPVLAETWELSCHPDGESVIAGGIYDGKTLTQYIGEAGENVLGANCRRFSMFPVLVKLIDARQDLSVQVHPSDSYALEKEGQYGKTEMWVVLDCQPGAKLYYGFARQVSKEECRTLIEKNQLLQVLNAVPVQPGDIFFIPAGTIHAIGAGITIAEIQQNSNLTYRVYDYGRVGADGKPRELHVEKALEVLDFAPSIKEQMHGEYLGRCSYFAVERLCGGQAPCAGIAGEDSFHHLLVIQGEGELLLDGERIALRQGDSLFVPAGSGRYTIGGNCTLLCTTVPPEDARGDKGIE